MERELKLYIIEQYFVYLHKLHQVLKQNHNLYILLKNTKIIQVYLSAKINLINSTFPQGVSFWTVSLILLLVLADF